MTAEYLAELTLSNDSNPCVEIPVDEFVWDVNRNRIEFFAFGLLPGGQ